MMPGSATVGWGAQAVDRTRFQVAQRVADGELGANVDAFQDAALGLAPGR